MEFYKSLTQKKALESSEDWWRRERAAVAAKKGYDQAQEIRAALDLPRDPEPDWPSWNPDSLIPPDSLKQLFPSPTPPWEAPTPPPITWRPQFPQAMPQTNRSLAPWPTPPPPNSGDIWRDDAPAYPSVVYPDHRVEVLALRPKDVWNAIKKGAEVAWDNKRWVVRVGSKVLGPVGAIGAVYDLYQFVGWVNDKLPKYEPGAPKTKYDPSSNQILWEWPGGGWGTSPPPA